MNKSFEIKSTQVNNVSKPATNTLPFCAAPFSQLSLHPTGKITPCLHNHDIILGYRDNNFQDVWNGKEIKKLRKEIINGSFVSCKDRMIETGCYRNYEMFNDTVDKSEIINKPPMLLDLRLNGACNLACIMCDVWTQPSGMYSESKFWAECKEYVLPQLKSLYVLGGEPFIQKDTFDLIDEVSKGNKDCSWVFETNGNIDFDKVEKYLKKIKIHRIGISIDSFVPTTYLKIRKKGDLNLVLTNIQKLVKFRDEYRRFDSPINLELTMCVFEENYKEIPEYINYCKKYDLSCFFHYVYYPEELSLNRLDQKKKTEILEFLNSRIENCDLHYLSHILGALTRNYDESEKNKYYQRLVSKDQNWLVNGTFKDGLTGYTIIGEVERVKSGDLDSVLVMGDDFEFRGLMQIIDLNDDVYSVLLSSAVKTDNVISKGNPWENARVTLEFLDCNDQIVGGYQPLTAGCIGTTDWKYYYREYVRNDQAKKIKVFFCQYGAKGKSYFADSCVNMLNDRGEILTR